MKITTTSHWAEDVFVPFAFNHNLVLKIFRVIVFNFEVCVEW